MSPLSHIPVCGIFLLLDFYHFGVRQFLVKTLKLKTLKIGRRFLKHIKIRKNPKDEPSILKIEQVTAVFVSQVVGKSQIQKIFKSQNLTDYLRFGPIFFLM